MEIASLPTQGSVGVSGGTSGGEGKVGGLGSYISSFQDLLKLLAQSNGARSLQQQPTFATLGQPAPQQTGQNVPVFNLSSALPQFNKPADSSGAVLGILSKLFFPGPGGGAK